MVAGDDGQSRPDASTGLLKGINTTVRLARPSKETAMRNDPFHERSWAELLFFLVVPSVVGAFGLWRFLDSGGWPDLLSAAVGLMMAIVMTYVIRQKLKASRSTVSRDGNG